MIADRQRIASIYDHALAGFENLKTVKVPRDGASNYYKYMAVLNEHCDRKILKVELREKHGVSLSGEVYEEPLHKQPVFERYAVRALPVAEDYCARQICLPVYSGMDETEAEQVIKALAAVIG